MRLEGEGLVIAVGSTRLIDDVSLAVEAGAVVALVGPNGAGKSTLLRALSGEIAPRAGRVRLAGTDIRKLSPAVLAQRRAMMAQSASVAFAFTVAEVVRMGVGGGGSPRTEALIDAALAEVDLAGFRERIITTLSGGEQQRVQFARVLAQLAVGAESHGPGLMLLDEPIAALDLRHQLDIADAMRRHTARGGTVLAVLHDLNIAARVADRIIVLDRGRLVADGPPSATITDAMLAEVFRVEGAVGRLPPPGAPFVLPHAMRAA
ncbi:heme ABC transporter ATP-binding protein [Blastochloris viridis]|uniref:ABC-type hemin transport system n=1 Tax=Blastochloris viridis TaxID=1079 RepID=A0A0H5B9F2_BLAVI|nr:heme ABC transporter ATP-binding protein [Blastochloris viridis]ALK08947.1 Hemin import ATP-binding protein HmuV [Blastochloris viridis]BAR97654.1 ABC-type hemin transport system [Blastochloris viridis]CUU41608.1 Hemin import ATP-binding protein HmuV [Blastochloris viridis]